MVGSAHADRVYRLAYRLTGNPHDAEDLTQETFIRVFRSLADYKHGTFEGWLHRITTNLFLDMYSTRASFQGCPTGGTGWSAPVLNRTVRPSRKTGETSVLPGSRWSTKLR